MGTRRFNTDLARKFRGPARLASDMNNTANLVSSLLDIRTAASPPIEFKDAERGGRDHENRELPATPANRHEFVRRLIAAEMTAYLRRQTGFRNAVEIKFGWVPSTETYRGPESRVKEPNKQPTRNAGINGT